MRAYSSSLAPQRDTGGDTHGNVSAVAGISFAPRRESGGDTHGNVSAVAGKTVEATVEIGFVEQMTYTQIGPGHKAVETDTIVTYLVSSGGQKN
eukprot:1728243-Karenia_brevis.AAC.1